MDAKLNTKELVKPSTILMYTYLFTFYISHDIKKQKTKSGMA